MFVIAICKTDPLLGEVWPLLVITFFSVIICYAKLTDQLIVKLDPVGPVVSENTFSVIVCQSTALICEFRHPLFKRKPAKALLTKKSHVAATNDVCSLTFFIAMYIRKHVCRVIEQ